MMKGPGRHNKLPEGLAQAVVADAARREARGKGPIKRYGRDREPVRALRAARAVLAAKEAEEKAAAEALLFADPFNMLRAALTATATEQTLEFGDMQPQRVPTPEMLQRVAFILVHDQETRVAAYRYGEEHFAVGKYVVWTQETSRQNLVAVRNWLQLKGRAAVILP